MHKFIIGLALLASVVSANVARAATPQDMLRDYEAAARKEAGDFKAGAGRGESFFRTERAAPGKDKQACAGCHTADPRQSGKTRAGKTIEPLAPAANPARFTDAAKAEKWFGRNCNDVLGRACSAGEKADFIAWLLTIK